MTRSEWVKILKGGNLLTLDRTFFSSFSTVTPSEPLKRLCKGHKIAGFNFNTHVSEEPKDGVGSREFFGRVVQKVIDVHGLARRHDCDGRNKSSVGSHKPDYLERSSESSGEQGVLCLGEIKGMNGSDSEFADEDVGQILDFVQALLTQQAWRQWAFGFLTDGIRFEFFRGARSSNGKLSFTTSGLHSKESGWVRLSQLLQQSDQCLGYTAVTVPDWKLDSWLGSGETTSVYSATSATKEVAVCKIYIGEKALASRDNEWEALEMMSDDINTPKIKSKLMTTGGEQSFPVLVVTPLGRQLGSKGVRLPIHAYAPLVDTLLCSHQRGRCHLDVCGDNMFAVELPPEKGQRDLDYRIILNDWASSMPTEVTRTATEFYTHKLFYDANHMGPEEDLAALVRSVFMLTMNTFTTNVKTFQDLDQLMCQQWNWGRALEKAREGNYDAVRHFFLYGSIASAGSDACCEDEESVVAKKRKG